ncbi:hypothetical protein CO2235_90233 [Cupriavidus oxalaticus]|uniref:Uncharacterized protein n=1 Tax=Cupriavidus oxalaticus TaxID=96344 RepID=A0A976BFE7_9BURK|nr:hypothetical protein CO2235_90233 [Cupriavidus oxalaticus]
MGTFERIERPDGRFAVSLVKWGILRRLIVSLMYRVSRPNKFERPSFVPAFELAVFPSSSLTRPVVVIHFSDEQAARRGWEAILMAMREHGLDGAANYVCSIRLSEMREFGRIYPEAL